MKSSISYAGIGARTTPQPILSIMEKLGAVYAKMNYTLRSGGAAGADSAFESGCLRHDGPMEIYLPWSGAFDRSRKHKHYIQKPSRKAFDIAGEFHPAWNKCSSVARKFHARNSHQILGENLDDPASFVVCWHLGAGGTMQAIRIAEKYDVTIINLADENTFHWLLNRLRNKYPDICGECNL